jgi:hypothetical protein
MGIKGPRDRTIDSILAARGRGLDCALVLVVLGLTPVLAGCSSFSSSSSATGTSAATYQPAAAAAPAGDPTASMAPYPSRSLVEVFSGDSPSSSGGASGAPGAAPRQVMPRPPSTYTASAPPYQTNPNGYDMSAGSAAAPARPAPAAARDDSELVAGYPTQSLTDLFSR